MGQMRTSTGITAFAGASFIRLLGHTWRIHYLYEDIIREVRRDFPAVIYAFWHGRLLPLSFTHRQRAIQVLASEHRDGELMGRTIQFLGFGHVRGSSSRGGARAIMQLAEKVRQRFDLGITVDGPKGPRLVVKPGPLEIAKLTGVPVVPITTSSRNHWTFSSWDEFQMPKPFTHVYVLHGDPVFVPAGTGLGELEEKRIQLQEKLLAITEEGDETARSGKR